MSYKVTITNNENGKVLVDDENAVAIVGAIGNVQGTCSIGFIDCDAISLRDAISEAEDIISKIKNEVPAVDVLLQLKAMADKIKANNND